jgi:SAP domain
MADEQLAPDHPRMTNPNAVGPGGEPAYAGPTGDAPVPIPADELDRRARVEKATMSEEESRAMTPVTRPEPASGDFGTGPYEDRTLEQLKALAESRGLSSSGTKAELADRLRG